MNKKLNWVHILFPLIVLLFCTAVMFEFIDYKFIAPTDGRCKGYYVNDKYDSPTKEFVDEIPVEQDFVASGDIYGIKVMFHNARQPQKGSFTVELFKKGEQNSLTHAELNTETLVNDGYSTLMFEKPYNGSADECEYTVKMTPHFENSAAYMRIWQDEKNGDIAFGIINYRLDYKAVRNYFKVLCLLTILAEIVVYIVCFVLKPKKEQMFAVTYLLVSIVFTLVLPPYSSPDEEAHFNSAYRLANRIEGYSSRQLAEETIYRRAEDVNETFENKYTDVFTYEYIGKYFFEKSQNNNIVSTENNWTVHDFDGVYFMGALGILAGKTLNLGYIQMAYLGRIFNLLFFTICLYFAIKITPTGKNIFMVLGFLPIVMHITNSFSRDTFVISLGFLLAAYLLSLLNQKECYKMWQLILLVVICTLLAPSKCIYSVMCLLVLLLDRQKISALSKVKKDKKALFKVIVCVAFALAVLAALI